MRFPYLSFVSLAAILLAGCDNNSKTAKTASPTAQPAVAAAKTASPTAQPVVAAACALPFYNLEKIPLAGAKMLDSVAVARLYCQLPGLKAAFATYDASQQVYLLPPVRYQGFTLLPLYRTGEEYFHELYYLTQSDSGAQLQSWVRVASWGMVQELEAFSHIKQVGPALRAVTINKVDDHGSQEDKDYDTYKYTQDSIVYEYRLTSAGQIVKTRLDSVQRIVRGAPEL